MTEKLTEDAVLPLKRIQDFDVQKIPQLERLGQELSFQDALIPSRKTQSLFLQFPAQFIEELPKKSNKYTDGLR